MRKNDYRTGAEMIRDLSNHQRMLQNCMDEMLWEQERSARKAAAAVASLSTDQKDAIAARVAARRDRVRKSGRLSS